MLTALTRTICQQINKPQLRTCVASATLKKTDNLTKQYDALQLQALKEQCILVDENDKAIGFSTKADCHRVNSETKEVKLHRAFSVFLFNTKGEMLVQRRSEHKVCNAKHKYFIISIIIVIS